MKLEKEGFVITVKAETQKDREDLREIAKGKIHYYPQTDTVKIF